MKFLILLLVFISFPLSSIKASSEQAYQDYRYQYELFRQYTASYRVAINEYKQYGSLTSQQKAIDLAKSLLIQRNLAAKLYYLLLNEKLTENPGMNNAEKEIYRGLLTNEIAYVDNQSTQIRSVDSLDELGALEKMFIANAKIRNQSLRSTILALQIGYLEFFAGKYDRAAQGAQALMLSQEFTPQKKASLERWLAVVADKRTQFQEKINIIRATTQKKNTQDTAQQYATLETYITDARQILIDGVGYMKEIGRELSYE